MSLLKSKDDQNLQKDITEKITVLIPMYNAEKTVEKCVRSVMAQTYTNLDIIVVDDGSVDNSYEIVMHLAENDKRIRLLHKENEQSLAKTREYLLDKVTTEYFVFVDSDDVVKKKYIEHLYQAMIKYDADCVASGFKINGIIPFSSVFAGTKVINDDDILSTAILSKTIHYVVWNKMYKMSIIHQMELDTSVNFGEDFVLCYNYFCLCKKVVFINCYDYKYILTKGSMIHNKFSNGNVVFLDWLEKTAAHEQVTKNKQALYAWIAFTSASFKYLMKKSKYKDEVLTARLNENIRKYNDNFVKNKFSSKIFRLAYKFSKGIK